VNETEPNQARDALTVLYDGQCPLCQREIAHVRGLAQRSADAGLCFVDISAQADTASQFSADRAALLARFHVQRADGSRIDGAAAFAAMWARLPGWRWLARFAQLPGMLYVLEVAYRGFLRIRPQLQKLARRRE
jgi:3-demethoxyubiquinol 3-hydroxylase